METYFYKEKNIFCKILVDKKKARNYTISVCMQRHIYLSCIFTMTGQKSKGRKIKQEVKQDANI